MAISNKVSKVKPNFKNLWTQAMQMAKGLNDTRTVSVLANHKENPERICRKLGIVCQADIVRMKTLAESKTNRQTLR
jgi:hypothetical protein